MAIHFVRCWKSGFDVCTANTMEEFQALCSKSVEQVEKDNELQAAGKLKNKKDERGYGEEDPEDEMPAVEAEAEESAPKERKKRSPLERRVEFLKKKGAEHIDWLQNVLKLGDIVYTPFGCGSDKLVYAAQQHGAVVRCCIPRLVKNKVSDTQFFYALGQVQATDWYTLTPIDFVRLRIKLLASVRLSVQKTRVRSGNQALAWGADLEMLGAAPVSKTYKSFADLFEHKRKAEHELEANVTKSLGSALEADPVYAAVFEPIPGVAHAIAGYIIGCILRTSRFPTLSHLYGYAGLGVNPDGQAPKRKRGEAGNWNPNLKRVLLGLLAPSMVRQAPEDSVYRRIYDARRAYEIQRNPKIKKGLSHRRAMRYMAKKFLAHVFNEWRRFERQTPVEQAA